MKRIYYHALSPRLARAAILSLILPLTLISTGCDQIDDFFSDDPKVLKDYKQVNLVANTSEEYDAARVDPKLVNAWGIAFSPTGIAWVNAAGTGLSFVYDKDGNELRPAVAVPSADGSSPSPITGIIFNGSTDFKLPNGDPARFIFDGVDGVITGWNTGNEAVVVVDNSATAAYTGLASATAGGASFLYAANFRSGKIDVFDANFAPVTDKPFTDSNLPAGYAPFNIQNIDNELYVLYAKVGANGRDEAGAGQGYVSVFNPDGHLLKRFASKGQLNAPWGIAKAPAGFIGNSDGAILVGNFGDGRINAYAMDGEFIGQINDQDGPITIEGLWAISFVPGTATNIDPNRLYFAAGPDDEEHGLFGYITK
ncbi:TIGR03118 family protein [Pontibacter sp. 172403-2]|uniref:TIGR03118 family protein n=1 Tax=Pontibacter rufus TaxID=2791028 RepID=UPI0018AF54CA|nr:TIGR03118 family protein [Pontibacter sp. 172403-2]MBF9254097.1 TIGR03118 family protein [Pontibacter sp. 172403-2]